MELQTVLQALLLGVVEGLTEFLPVSSTGHLIFLIDVLQFQGPPGKVFEIVIQLGAILAVCWIYRARLFGAVWAAPRDPVKRQFLLNILIAFFPSAVVGAVLHDFIKQVLFNPHIVAVMLMVGGVAILLIERFRPAPRTHEVEQMSGWLALKIGLIQTLSIIPGTSRSGATIMGALLLGVDRKAAAEFSFFLAIPTMLGATVYDIYKNYAVLEIDGAGLIVLGFIAAFVTALVVVRLAIGFVSRYGFAPFAWYRLAMGAAMLLVLSL
jgi:undecaprenyl-diphosphatase